MRTKRQAAIVVSALREFRRGDVVEYLGWTFEVRWADRGVVCCASCESGRDAMIIDADCLRLIE